MGEPLLLKDSAPIMRCWSCKFSEVCRRGVRQLKPSSQRLLLPKFLFCRPAYRLVPGPLCRNPLARYLVLPPRINHILVCRQKKQMSVCWGTLLKFTRATRLPHHATAECIPASFIFWSMIRKRL